jgi:uncharacterized membrane protein YidH (DUF202 family)
MWPALCFGSRSRRIVVKLIGTLLIIFGLVALAVGGLNYTKRETVVDLGPIHATADRQKTIPLPPVAGIASIVAGVVLVVAGSRRSV